MTSSMIALSILTVVSKNYNLVNLIDFFFNISFQFLDTYDLFPIGNLYF
jgi:hypothetical protein